MRRWVRAFNEVEGALAAEIAARDREQILMQVLSDNERAGLVQTHSRWAVRIFVSSNSASWR